MTFDLLGLPPSILRTLAAVGYAEPTPIQAQSIPALLAGRDLLGCAQTGTGKTAAFALPLLSKLIESPAARGQNRPIRVLVLAPTRELAVQITASFNVYGRHTGLRWTTIVGGVNQQPQVRSLRAGLDVLVATPGRLLDLLDQGHVRLDQVQAIVLDEADRMFDMGFLPDVNRILGRLPAERQTILFSATMPGPIEQLANRILRDPVRVEIAPIQATTDLIEESVCYVERSHKPDMLARLIAARPVERALVFTRTRRGADRVARHLSKSGIRSEAMHGDKSQAARQRILASFRSDRPPVLVATDVASRGLDIKGVSHVFNFEMPHEPETYVHRIGRTGRAGATGVAVSLCDGEERKHLRAIERLIQRKLPIEPTSANEVSHAERPARKDAPRNDDHSPRPPKKHASNKERPFVKKRAVHGPQTASPAGDQPAAAGESPGDRGAAQQGGGASGQPRPNKRFRSAFKQQLGKGGQGRWRKKKRRPAAAGR